jgi:hypothetical protein
MRQQLFDPAGRVRWQPLEHVLEVGVRIVPVELGRVHQAHHRAARLPARRLPANSQFAAQRNRPDLVLHPVVVDRQFAVVDVARERCPALEAVVDGRAVADPSGTFCRCWRIHWCSASATPA